MPHYRTVCSSLSFYFSIPFHFCLKITFVYIKTKASSASCSCLDICFFLYMGSIDRFTFTNSKKEKRKKGICMPCVRYYVWLVLQSPYTYNNTRILWKITVANWAEQSGERHLLLSLKNKKDDMVSHFVENWNRPSFLDQLLRSNFLLLQSTHALFFTVVTGWQRSRK